MRPTNYISKFVVDASFEDLPGMVVDRSKACLLDWIGVTLGGMKEPSSQILFDLVKEIGGEGQATILGRALKTTTLNAALVNGTMSHVLDYDDAHNETRNHTSAPLVPALLAMAEYKRLGGRDLITAYVVGFEVSTRIGLAFGKQYYEKGWHATAILGRFGAAVGTGKILRFNARQVANALGLAATQSGGIREVFGTMGKPFHAGKAAMDGMLSALLSQRGFTGPQDILDDASEYVDLFSSEYNPDFITRPVIENYHIMRNSIKLYAACLLLHPVIDGLLSIKNECSPDPKDIELVDLEVAPLCLAVTDNPSPHTGMQGKFSIYFCAALALTEGKVGGHDFTESCLNDPQIKGLMQRVNVKTDPALKETEARIAVHTSKRSIHTKHISAPKGDPSNPVTFEEIVEKFRELSKDRISGKNIEEIIGCVRHLETVPDITRLVNLCCPDQPT